MELGGEVRRYTSEFGNDRIPISLINPETSLFSLIRRKNYPSVVEGKNVDGTRIEFTEGQRFLDVDIDSGLSENCFQQVKIHRSVTH